MMIIDNLLSKIIRCHHALFTKLLKTIKGVTSLAIYPIINQSLHFGISAELKLPKIILIYKTGDNLSLITDLSPFSYLDQ